MTVFKYFFAIVFITVCDKMTVSQCFEELKYFIKKKKKKKKIYIG